MPKFNVTFTETVFYRTTVEAENSEQAKAAAREAIENEDFHEFDNSGFDIDEITEAD